MDAVRANGEDQGAAQRALTEELTRAQAEIRALVAEQTSALRQQLLSEAAERRHAENEALNGQGKHEASLFGWLSLS